MEHICDIYQMIQNVSAKKVAVAAAADSEVLEAVCQAQKKNLILGQLFGEPAQIREILFRLGEDPGDYEIVSAATSEEAADLAVQSVSGKDADILMKGMLNSSVFIKAVLNKEHGLKKEGHLLSAMAVVEVRIEGKDRLLFIADPGFIPLPDLEEKKGILMNCVEALHILGYENPKVAVLSATEQVNFKMISSQDAHALEEMYRQGSFPGCIVGGPLSLDLAVSEKSAQHKGFVHPVAGKADLLLVPSVEVGNALLKALTFILKAPAAGAVAGTTSPVVFTSRSDSAQVKQNTIAMAVWMAERMAYGKG